MRTAILAALVVMALRLPASAQLIVHEWGTFTSLQDESGRTIGGINTDDEPAPDFVHRAVMLIQSNDDTGKGIPANDPEVTIRLETPVLYFHLPPGQNSATVNVSVSFRGGWLTEFFPNGQTFEPGLESSAGIGHLDQATVGTLNWPEVHVGDAGDEPKTDDPVWTSLRNVRCDALRVNQEAEKFLFYRGVGHIDSPLRTEMDSDGTRLTVYGDTHATALPQFWLVDVRQDRTVAWRMLDPLVSPAGPLASGDTRFAANDYGDGAALERSLHQALVSQGLFGDEAQALLNTWRQSYFRNPGLRLFFLVNPAWTNRVLPLTVSGNVSITRVMMGRIELVTPRQRELISQITSGGFNAAAPPNQNPAYEQLGRFRNALLLDEILRHPNARLANWLGAWSVRAFVPR